MPLDDKLARKVAKKQLLEEEKRCIRKKKQFSWDKNITEYPSSEEYEEENHKYSGDNEDDEEEKEKNI